jgi:hypothetical protein
MGEEYGREEVSDTLSYNGGLGFSAMGLNLTLKG